MCAVENGTLSLYKRSSIKQHCLCEEHKKRRDKSQSNKQASSDVYTGEESSGEISTDDESNLNRNIVSSLTSETSNKSQKTPQSFQKRPLLKPNVQTNDAPPRKFFKAASINPFKPGDGIKVPVKAPNVKISQQNKINANPWEWLKDKLSTLTQTITAIENMPIELQRNLTNVKKEVNSSPLDSLVDSAFDNQSTSLLEEKNNEIMQLKQMLQLRPTAEAYKQLQDELTALKSVDTKSVVQYRINQENALAIFSNLKLPNIMAPTESNISQFLSTLRAILERSSSSQGTPSPVTPNVTTGIPPTTISTQSAPMGSIQSSQSPYTPVNQSPITLPPMSALTSHAYNPPIRNVSIRNIPPQ
ncbi:hypothetical protein HDV02_000493 [Globomyces sp. JEL0801]|nr:hypothetical protein HDV02_000493 [Globomyces sp. JEL0801]